MARVTGAGSVCFRWRGRFGSNHVIAGSATRRGWASSPKVSRDAGPAPTPRWPGRGVLVVRLGTCSSCSATCHRIGRLRSPSRWDAGSAGSQNNWETANRSCRSAGSGIPSATSGSNWLQLEDRSSMVDHAAPRRAGRRGRSALVGQHHRTFDASKRDSVVPERGRVGLAFEQGVIEQIALQHQTRQCEVVADTLDEFVRQCLEGARSRTSRSPPSASRST